MSHTSHVRALDRWVTIEHPGREDDFKVIEEVLVGNVYRLEPDQVDGKVVVDAGAHVGTFSSLAIRCGARVLLTIEPNEDNVEYLERNVRTAMKDRETEPIVTFCTLPVGDRRQPDVRLVGEGATGQMLPGGNLRAMDLLELLDTVRERIDFLKIDVEGAEYGFFDAAMDADIAQVNLIRGEWHGHSTASAIDGEGPIGELVQKLLRTHSVTLFGRPKDGGILLAHAYEWPE